ncbi:MAG: TonB-dependent receptor, partial [Bacteroidales bacterium]|nr:TonB-dependent receptor [Bacteroidales bacterium]
MKGKFFFSFFLLFPVVLTAQIKSSYPVQKDITGVVWEVSTNDTIGASIPLATVQLLNFKDSSLVKGIAADLDGKFVFQTVPQNNYLLAVSFVGYNTRYIYVPDSLFRLPKEINLGKILLKEQSFMLSEAVILGQAPEVVVKEDTLEYNPVAFKMEDGAVVEDLLKRMPGMEVDPDGNVTSAGKEIKRIFVNGKEFFGNDPKMATKNLTIDVIEKVQVIEKKSDMAILTGVDDGETETIINLTIKESRNKGWMGNISAGMGALVDNRNNEEPRYNTRTMVNRFVGDNQTSIVINANNLGRGGNGIAKTNSFGINTSNKLNDQLKFNGNVRYNYNENLLKQHSFRTNLLIDSVSYRKNSSRNQNYTHNLTFNGKLEYQPDSLLTVVFSPRISYNHAVTNNLTNQSTMAGNADSTLVNQSEGSTRRETDGLTLGGELTVTRLFSKKGRRLSLRLNGNLNHNQGDGSNLSTSLFFLQQNRNKYLDQESETSSKSNSYSIRASYVEPLREHMTLQVYYDFRKNDTRNIKKTYDYDSINYVHSILNHDYSKSLSNAFITQTIGINLNGQHEKYYYNLGVNIIPSNTQSTNFIKEGASNGSDSTLNRIPKRKVVNYSPLLNLTYRFNRQTNLRFTYRGNTTQPSVTQLDPTPNNTNPLNLRTGNPDLLPSFTNSMSLRLNMNNREKQRSLTASVDYSFTRNQIINFTSYEEETGIQHTKPINENGSWNTSG